VAGFLQKFYAQVYITVIVENHYADVSIRVEKMGRLIKEKQRRFEITGGTLSKEVTNYIERAERKSPFSYIAVLNPVSQQGAMAGCSQENMSDKVSLCIGNKKRPWSIFVDAAYLQGVQKKFAVTGIDFIFSPFSIIPLSTKEIKEDKAQLFVFVLEKMMSIAVFRRGTLEFAKHVSLEEPLNEFDMGDDDLMLDDDLSMDDDGDLELEMDIEEDTVEAKEEGLEDLDALEDLDGLDELDELDGLDELDDLDELDELGEDEALEDFTDESDPVNETEELTEELEMEEEAGSASLSGFSRNFRRFEHIQESIHDFYHNSDLESSFIEDVYVLDPYEDCEDLRAYLEDELFVSVHFKNFNLQEMLLVLSKNEVKDAS
jgi:hypothetical protein